MTEAPLVAVPDQGTNRSKTQESLVAVLGQGTNKTITEVALEVVPGPGTNTAMKKVRDLLHHFHRDLPLPMQPALHLRDSLGQFTSSTFCAVLASCAA